MENEVKNEQVLEEKPKKLPRKERKAQKIRNEVLSETDIKFCGPLSYRGLRIIAWIALAVGQLFMVNSISTHFLSMNFLGDVGGNIVNFVGGLATPLFIIASFGLVLSNKRKVTNFVILYGGAYIALGVGLCLAYKHYIEGFLATITSTPVTNELVGNFFANKVNVNVFADLFAFSAFVFFLNYNPKLKVFSGKRIYIFRAFMALPIIFILTSYVFKILSGFEMIVMPFYAIPFLTTKSPVVFILFVLASVWIKNRGRIYKKKYGISSEEYNKYLSTNRNSLSFSKHLSYLIAVVGGIEFFVILVISTILILNGAAAEEATAFINLLSLGDCSVMIFVIPFIMLYSYSRDYKDTRIDMMIPLGGIALTVFIYIESIFQVIIATMSK